MQRSRGLMGLFISTACATLLNCATTAHAGTELDGKSAAAGISAPVTDSPQPLQSESTQARDAPLTMVVESPTGRLFKLVYRPQEGWKLAALNAAKIDAAAAHPDPDGAAPIDVVSDAKEPLTVFIDGPTGYTFVWMRDKGWKFIGRVTSPTR
jgi:hypothetical protein